MNEIRVTINDVRMAGYCGSGLREFCDAHGINLPKLIREGLPVEELEKIEDARIHNVLEQTYARVNDGR